MRDIAVIDYETESIEDRPAYPPKPVGVAIRFPDSKTRYYAWGHPRENNCTKAEAVRVVRQVVRDCTVIYHNAPFDLEVQAVHMGIAVPLSVDRFEDTLVLAYLHNPRDRSLSLKPLADKYLGMPPKEQEAVRDWILANIVVDNGRGGTKPVSETEWGAHIASAPGALVGRYAVGDVVRTFKLFKLFYKHARDNGMLEWYQREKRTELIKIKMEQGGIRADVKKIRKDLPKFEAALEGADKAVKKALKITPAWIDENCPKKILNLGSPKQLAAALRHSGKISEFIKTAKGADSVSYENLVKTCNDKKLLALMGFQGTLSSYVNTFLGPWLHRAEQDNGFIHPSFNTVRSTDEYGGKGGFGTRTGRLSSSNPNFQNIPASVEDSQNSDLLIPMQAMLSKDYNLEFIGLRDYLIPDEGCVFIGRDYNQQELRILAHYENGILMRMYQADPDMDIHEVVRQLVRQSTGMLFVRKHVKITNFGIIYGQGAASLAKRLGLDEDTTKLIRNGIYTAVPGIKELGKELKLIANAERPIRTWGGRVYYCEEPAIVDGRMQTFEYKMLNLLIQGSAADCTKQAMINVDDRFQHARQVLQVHDELLGCVPIQHAKREMQVMKEAMEDVAFDVRMTTDGKTSARSWARMK